MFQLLFQAPQSQYFEDEEKRRVAGVLHTLLVSCFFAALLLIVPAALWSSAPMINIAICISAALICFALVCRLQSGSYKCVTVAVVAISVGLSLIINLLASRPFPLAICVSLISLLAAGLYLSRRGIMVVVGVNIATVLAGLVFWLLQTRYPISTNNVLVDACVLMCQIVAAGLICLLSLRELRHALGRAQRAQADLLTRNRELTSLLEISRMLNSDSRLDQQLNFIVQKLDEVAPFDWVELLALETEGHIATTLAAPLSKTQLRPFFVGAAKTLPNPAMSLLSQSGFETYLAEIAKRQDAVVITDHDAMTAGTKIGASLMVPLISQDRVVGILVLHARRPDHFTDAFIATAATFASQAALAIENARLQSQALQAAAFSATLAERGRIARDLHDSVSQALFGIVLGARTLQAMPLDANGRHAASYTLDLSEAALAEMRALVFELDPESVNTEGLITVLERHAAALCARHKIDVKLSLGEREPDLPGMSKEALYRICIEAIQNIIKHAHASQVLIHMEVADPCVSLEVKDNGRGFNPNLLYPGQLGLVSMRTHAEQAGGSLHIHSAEREGTSVRVVVPV